MTEAEWLACADPEKMLSFLGSQNSEGKYNTTDRKDRLCAVAFCYRVWDRMDQRSRQAVLALERLADGLASVMAVRAAWARAPRTTWEWMTAAWATPDECANLLRDIFNPYRPVALDPAWLTPDVLSLAQASYEDRALPSGTLDPARLGMLADALEDAGCDNADLLGHLRGEGPHVRGCWAVDLILGKE